MNKYCFLLISINLLLIGCLKDTYSTTYEYIIINPLNQHFNIEMAKYEPRDTIFSTIPTQGTLYIIGKTIGGQTRRTWGNCNSYFTTLYNLPDTTKITGEFGCQVFNGLPDYTGNRSPFAEYTSFMDKIIGEYHQKVIYTLTITSTLLQHMQKDTTMLQKFKDYYSTSH